MDVVTLTTVRALLLVDDSITTAPIPLIARVLLRIGVSMEAQLSVRPMGVYLDACVAAEPLVPPDVFTTRGCLSLC